MPAINIQARKVLRGYVVVSSDLDQPIERTLFCKKRYRTLCAVTFQFGSHKEVVPAGYYFDGPTIPRPLWVIAGLSPLDDETVLPSLIHDWICDNPDVLPRVMGDGLFVTAMSVMVFNGRVVRGVPRWRRIPMYLAVRAWTTYVEWSAESATAKQLRAWWSAARRKSRRTK